MPPPKKVAKIDPKQRSLAGIWGKTSVDHDDSAAKDVPVAASGNNSIMSPKIRKFNAKWLTLYSWLRYESADDYMFCTLCTNNKKMNGMNKATKNTNFQNSTLTRHAALADHKLCVEASVHRDNLKQLQSRNVSQQDKAMQALLRCLHWMCTENLPMSKFKSFIDFLHELEVPDLSVLKKCPFGYDSEYTASELLDSLATVAENDLKDHLNQSPVVTVLTDESTDICNTKRLVIYAQLISQDMKPSTVYVNNIECTDTTGKGIATAVIDELSQRGVPSEKIMSLGSDGASVMTGKHNGVAAIMRRGNPHMVNVHCVAHRLALCTSQAAADIPVLHKHQQILTDLFYYFKGSSKRETRLREIQDILDDPSLTVKEIHSVRWLSYFNALTSVFRTLDSLLTYLAELGTSGKDPKATGLKKKMATDTFVATTYMLMDAMAPVTILSQFFQTENVDVALVKIKHDMCLSDLQKVKEMETPHLKQLKEDLQTDKLRGQHEITRTNFDLKKLTSTFIDALVSNITSRFPDTDLLGAFSVLGMRPITHLSPQDLATYGQREMDTLCDFYGQKQTVQWKVEKDHNEKTSEPIVNADATKREWQLAKLVVKAEMYPTDNMWKLWQLISVHHAEDFPNLLTLARLALTSAVHTAGCERGFSMQNQLLTKSRNRLTVDKQNKLMRVKLCGFERDEFVQKALPVLKKKERRLYNIKIV